MELTLACLCRYDDPRSVIDRTETSRGTNTSAKENHRPEAGNRCGGEAASAQEAEGAGRRGQGSAQAGRTHARGAPEGSAEGRPGGQGCGQADRRAQGG